MKKRISLTLNGKLLGFLFITFLLLKLCGIITWSWWWVAAPLWMPIAFFTGIILAAFFFHKKFLL